MRSTQRSSHSTSRNDVVLRVPGLEGRPLGLQAARSGIPVAILGYPEKGPFTVTPARIGQTTNVITDAPTVAGQ